MRQKSRDFFWYSPVLNEKLKGVRGDLVVCPATKTRSMRTLAYCHAHRIAVTPRGAGTGNYGQAMPLQGGIVLDLSRLDRFLWLKDGVARVQAGLKLIDLEAKACRRAGSCASIPRRAAPRRSAASSPAARAAWVRSSSAACAIAATCWALRVITMEAKPRVLELAGDDVMPAVHAYGTNGIITELELPLARAWPWHETLVAFADIGRATAFGNALGEADGVIKKLITAFDWSTAQYFKPLLPHMPQGQAIVLCMIADSSREPFAALAADDGRPIVFERPMASESDDIPPLYEFTWNHTTLWALKSDRTITYLQCLFNGPDYLDKIARTIATFGDETPMHLEFTRFDGHVAAFGLQLVRFTSEKRLYEIIGWLEANGVAGGRPAHLYFGGRRHEDRRCRATRLQAPERPAGPAQSGENEGLDRRRILTGFSPP